MTTIKDDKGERVVGTELDTNGQAYKEISNGKDYFGEADILGSKYMTGYAPIYDSNKQIIGIYFVGVPIESVNSILNVYGDLEVQGTGQVDVNVDLTKLSNASTGGLYSLLYSNNGGCAF